MSLHLRNVSRAFARRTLFAPIDLELKAGSAAALLGPNGSGKTTLLRIIAGQLRPSTGTVEAGSFRFVSQDVPVYPELTPAEHATWLGQDPACLAAAGLARVLHQPARVLSRGQRQRLHLALALDAAPELLLLDEPYAGLDEAGTQWLQTELQKFPGAILLAAHEPNHVQGTPIHLEAP